MSKGSVVGGNDKYEFRRNGEIQKGIDQQIEGYKRKCKNESCQKKDSDREKYTLNHVSYWNEGKWIRITPKDVESGYSISHYSGLFKCDLCNQLVEFISGKSVISHFKHANNNKFSDSCPEKLNNNNNIYIAKNRTSYRDGFEPRECQIPIRLNLKNSSLKNSRFSLEMGFPSIISRSDLTHVTIKISRESLNNSRQNKTDRGISESGVWI